MRCPSCGAKLPNSSTECPSCGTIAQPKTAYYGGAARTVRTSWGLPVDEAANGSSGGGVSTYLMFAIIALLLIIGMLTTIVIMQNATTASSGLVLDATSFPDRVLLEAVSSYDANSDGRLSDAEAASVTSLNLSESGVTDLTGVCELKSLVDLDAHGNGIEQVKLDGLVRLQRLDLSRNNLASFSAVGLHELIDLDVSDNALEALDLSGGERLVSLDCTGNKIARLDLSDCTGLLELACDPDQNVTIPLSPGFFPDETLRNALRAYDSDGDGALGSRERQAVTTLTINGGALQDLYGLAWFDALGKLDVSDTRLSSVDGIHLCPTITSISACGCQIDSVDLTGLSHIVDLDLSNNPIRTIDLTSLAHLTSIDLNGCDLQGTLDLSGCKALTSVDVRGNPSLNAIVVPDSSALGASGAIRVDRSCTVNTARVV